MIRVIRELEGAYSSKVELVEIDGVEYVRKTAELAEIKNEEAFYHALLHNHIPSLSILDHPDLKDNQLLLEYIPGSPTLEKVLTPDLAEKWGDLVRQMHGIAYDLITVITDSGDETYTQEEFIEREIQYGLLRQTEKGSDLSEDTIRKVVAFVDPLKRHAPQKISLAHNDLHANNVLVKGERLALFDKGSTVFAADPLYDLATVYRNYSQNVEIFNAFTKGYGHDFTQSEAFDRYLALNILTNYPNPFNSNLIELLKDVLPTEKA